MRLISNAAAIAGLFAIAATPASALNTRTWLSGKGADQSGCGPIANPCRTLQYAVDATNDGGEVNILDPAGYGSVTIGKSIAIVNDGVGTAGVLAGPGQYAIGVFAAQDAVITLRGLTIEGAGTGKYGIFFSSGGKLTVANCVVQNFGASTDGGYIAAGSGIALQYSSNSPDILISNTTLSNNANAGLYYSPYSGGVFLTLDTVTASQNTNGVVIRTTTTTDTSYANVIRSTASNNSNAGIALIGGGAYSNNSIGSSFFVGNHAYGLSVSGSNAYAYVGQSFFANRVYDLSGPSATTQIYSWSNNMYRSFGGTSVGKYNPG